MEPCGAPSSRPLDLVAPAEDAGIAALEPTRPPSKKPKKEHGTSRLSFASEFDEEESEMGAGGRILKISEATAARFGSSSRPSAHGTEHPSKGSRMPQIAPLGDAYVAESKQTLPGEEMDLPPQRMGPSDEEEDLASGAMPGLVWAAAECQGRRPYMEDRYDVVDLGEVTPALTGVKYMCILDGHGGINCCDFVKAQLPNRFAAALTAELPDARALSSQRLGSQPRAPSETANPIGVAGEDEVTETEPESGDDEWSAWQQRTAAVRKRRAESVAAAAAATAATAATEVAASVDGGSSDGAFRDRPTSSHGDQSHGLAWFDRALDAQDSSSAPRYRSLSAHPSGRTTDALDASTADKRAHGDAHLAGADEACESHVEGGKADESSAPTGHEAVLGAGARAATSHEFSVCEAASPQAIARAYTEAFRQVDDAFMEKATSRSLTDGSTVLCVTLRGATLDVANCGDTRAVIGRRAPALPRVGAAAGRSMRERELEALRLSVDHKPDLPEEAERVRASGGSVRSINGCWRVAGPPGTSTLLAISRAFGDRELKRCTATPLVSNEPFVSSRALCPLDRVLILASDGLWDVIDDSQAVKIAWDAARGRAPNSQAGALAAANALVRRASEQGSMDNITVIVAWLLWPEAR